ncbi:MAG: AraC family transcriptional regulator [Pseudomonas sp.]|nr:AraC family transcriptional regulator [Pseudomonas sp.]
MPSSTHDLNLASVSASLTQAVLHAAVRLGLQRAQLLTACGLSNASLDNPDARVPLLNQQALWAAIQRQLDGVEAGLLIGQALAPGQFSVLGYLLQSSPTLAAALQAVQRYQRLAGEGGEVSLQLDGERLWLVYQALHPEQPATRARVLALMAFWQSLMAPLLADFHLLGARFMHPQPADLQAYQEVFACPLQFAASDYALALPSALLEAPLAQANLPLQNLLREHAEALLARLPSESLSARVVALLSAQLSQGEPDRSKLAQALQLSERTLQRRLAEEGSSYQQLLNDSRRQLAEGYLRDSQLPAAEIALLLGYSEPSVFFRAFRQWSGLTPGEYRSRHHPQR